MNILHERDELVSCPSRVPSLGACTVWYCLRKLQFNVQQDPPRDAAEALQPEANIKPPIALHAAWIVGRTLARMAGSESHPATGNAKS